MPRPLRKSRKMVLPTTVASGALFQPVYLGRRNDVAPHDCGVSQLKYKAVEEEA